MNEIKKRIGVTRIANVTGLDRIGMPVVAAIRPLSRNITVSFGKGADAAQASLSALMEAAELHYSETPPGPLRTARFRDLRDEGAVDPARLGPIDPEVDLADVSFDWIAAEALGSGKTALLPWCLASMDFSLKGRRARRHLTFGATGLAAGFESDRAILHGLYEVIERDAHNAWNEAADVERAASLVDLRAVTSADVNALIDSVRAARLDVLAWDMTGPTGVPCYLVEIFDTAPQATTAYVQGAAADLSPAVALRKALAEAIQIRLTYISGSRDDLDWSDYGTRYDRTVANRQHVMAALEPRRKLAPEPEDVFDFREAIAVIRSRLSLAGSDRVLVIRLTGSTEPVHVVKVVVPSMHDLREVPSVRQLAPRREAVPA